MDSINSKRIATLHPSIRDEVFNLIVEADKRLTGRAKVRVVQAFRSYDEQDKIYAQGRTTPGKIVTKAKGGQSYHNFGLAFDYCLIIDGKEISWDVNKDWDDDGMADWREVSKVFEEKGYKWGKAFNDLPHIEKSFGYDWRQLDARYKSKWFISGTKFVQV